MTPTNRSHWGRFAALFLAAASPLIMPTMASVVHAQTAATQPTRQVNLEWSTLTLADLPTLQTSGGYQAPADLTQLLGFDLSRYWTAGQSVGEVLRLGDVADSFQLQQFTLEQIAELTGLDLRQLSLAEVESLLPQTIAELVNALPTLANIRLDQVPILLNLLQQQNSVVDPTTLIGDAIGDPAIANLALSSLPLENSPLESIPGLTKTPLETFANWRQAPLSSIPGLLNVPFVAFPNPVGLVGGTVAHVDIAFGTAEGDGTRAITGSYQQGFNVPCWGSCAHVELGTPAEGWQWISGLSQQVRGGYGFLGQVNGGQEPTGRHPYGPGFKVVLLSVDETTGSAEMGLYFRTCARTTFVDLGCTPYFIGPVPWLPVQEEGFIFLGPSL